MKIRLPKYRLILLCLALLPCAGYFVYHRYIKHNQAASCANCRRFIVTYLWEAYAAKHDGWFPRGAGDPMKSFALCIAGEPDRNFLVHVFTSHALDQQARAFYAEHQTFNEEYFCYRYNEGLRADDPGDLVLVYFHEPTDWECNEPRHRQDVIGRPVLTLSGMWDFIPEDEFQRRQQATRKLIESRATPPPAPPAVAVPTP